MKLLFGLFLAVGLLVTWNDIDQKWVEITDKTPVQDILEKLDNTASPNAINPSIESSVQQGKELVHQGFTSKNSWGKTRKQSKHFVCTSCHNVSKEFESAAENDPQKRLDYAVENNLPFLQGSTFYGIVNRTSFYNGDYFKKYGDLVVDARHDIRKSIQLCATECAQGRALDDWEIESILKYFWTLQYRVEDIALNEESKDLISNAMKGMASKERAADDLKAHYLNYSPASFVDPPVPRKGGREGYKGDIKNGENIYNLSCLHCHKSQRYSFFNLDNTKLSYRQLARNLRKYNHLSMYQVVRYGTHPVYGKKAYMPHYTLEKMSHQQMEDLRTFILDSANYKE